MTLTARNVEQLLLSIRQLISQGRVRFTRKALDELDELEIAIDEADCKDVLSKLTVADFSQRLVSSRIGELMYVFNPRVLWTPLYVKLVLRAQCVVISFHGSEDDFDEEEIE